MIIGTVRVGNKFDVCYVNNLYAMIRRNVSSDFTFLCITDKPKGLHPDIVIKYANSNISTWWHFMEFYSKDLGDSHYLDQHRIYFGLDTIIRANIDHIVERDQYTLSLDFNHLIGNPNPAFADTWADCAAVIPKGGLPWLYHAFQKEHKTSGIGNSRFPMHLWVTRQLREQGITPLLWPQLGDEDPVLCSYKWPEPKIEEPLVPMVFFHGPPMIHEVLDVAPWIKNHWHIGGI